MSKVDFLRSKEMTDSLRMGWNWPVVSERLTILLIVGTRTDAHFFEKPGEDGIGM